MFKFDLFIDTLKLRFFAALFVVVVVVVFFSLALPSMLLPRFVIVAKQSEIPESE